MKKHVIVSLISAALVSAAIAAPQSFDFKDPKGVNAIQFHLDSILEPISGTANGLTGTVSFDAANPGATTGKIVVAASSVTVSNSTMTEHLHSKNWIDVGTNPEITFEITKLANVSTKGNETTAEATGNLTLKGVTKEVTAPVKITYLADSFGKRLNKPELKGDLLVVRSEFTIQRGDFGIQPGKNEDKVNPEVKLSLAIVGGAPRS